VESPEKPMEVKRAPAGEPNPKVMDGLGGRRRRGKLQQHIQRKKKAEKQH